MAAFTTWLGSGRKHRGKTHAPIHYLAIVLSMALQALVSISLGEYRDPHAASEVFLFTLYFIER